MSAVVLDSHVVHWWSAEPGRLSRRATEALETATELVVSAITWYELAWLAERRRIVLSVPTRSWLDRLAADLRTIGITPAISHAAATLPPSFPGDPADRLIYATAVEVGSPLVTKDDRLRRHRHPVPVAVW